MPADLQDPSPRQRQQAAVDAARQQNLAALPQLLHLARCDPAQAVRKEAASAVGRLSRHSPQAFAALADLAQHPDPNVVIQAARGLTKAATPEQQAVAAPILKQLAHHQSELVQDFVSVETARTRSQLKSGGGGGKFRASP